MILFCPPSVFKTTEAISFLSQSMEFCCLFISSQAAVTAKPSFKQSAAVPLARSVRSVIGSLVAVGGNLLADWCACKAVLAAAIGGGQIFEPKQKRLVYLPRDLVLSGFLIFVLIPRFWEGGGTRTTGTRPPRAARLPWLRGRPLTTWRRAGGACTGIRRPGIRPRRCCCSATSAPLLSSALGTSAWARHGHGL